VSGDVLVTKNPCGHPGDIRQATAINESHPAFEKLKHLVNVIVFPLNGTGGRPLQNCMSGGDLDGDVYMIIWDKEIVQCVKKAHLDEQFPEPAPMDNKELEAECTEDLCQETYEIGKTVCGYFERDTLGKMSNLHLKLAIEHGVDNQFTKKASYLATVQVDFAKHGKCIKI
jgi:RNA-dependent RNA polymerase